MRYSITANRRQSCGKRSLDSLIKISYPLGICCCHTEIIILQNDIYRRILSMLSRIESPVCHNHILIQRIIYLKVIGH